MGIVNDLKKKLIFWFIRDLQKLFDKKKHKSFSLVIRIDFHKNIDQFNH